MGVTVKSRPECVTGLNEHEEEIIEVAYAMVQAQRMAGMLKRGHGFLKAGGKSHVPTTLLRRRALARIGLGEEQVQRWDAIAASQSEELADIVKKHPLWTEWAHAVKGLGPVMTGLIVAAIGDVTRVHNASGLWKSFGLHVVDGRAPRYEKRKPGEKGKPGGKGFPFARLVLGRIRVTIMKVGSQHGGYYFELYEKARKGYEENRPDWEKGRQFGAALRYFEKILLAHAWKVWRTAKGLPAPAPYIVMQDPLHHEIAPEEAMEAKRRGC